MVNKLNQKGLKEPKKGKVTWKLNVSLLKDKDYIICMRGILNYTVKDAENLKDMYDLVFNRHFYNRHFFSESYSTRNFMVMFPYS